MSCYLVQNSVTANSTLTLRRNGANVNNAIILTASTTGFFSVTNQTDEFGWGDDMAIQLVTGATGTQIEISNIVIFYKLPRLNKIFRYVFNIKARTSKQFRYKFNIVARTSKIFRYPFNIKQRISKVFRYPYRITQRAQRKSLVFDGTDDRIDCGNQSDLWSKSKTKFSFAFWIYPTATARGFDTSIVRHGWNSAGSFIVYQDSTNPNRIAFAI